MTGAAEGRKRKPKAGKISHCRICDRESLPGELSGMWWGGTWTCPDCVEKEDERIAKRKWEP